MAEEENKTEEKKSAPSWLNGFVIGLFVIGIILILAGAIYESALGEDASSEQIQNVSIVAAILIVVGILLIIPFIVVRTRPGRLERKANKAKEDERRALNLEAKLNFDRSDFNIRYQFYQEDEKKLSDEERKEKKHLTYKEMMAHCYEEINLATRAFNLKNLDMVEKHLGQFESLMYKLNKTYPLFQGQPIDSDKTSTKSQKKSQSDDSYEDVMYDDGTSKQDHEFFEEEVEDAELFDELDEMGDWFDDKF